MNNDDTTNTTPPEDAPERARSDNASFDPFQALMGLLTGGAIVALIAWWVNSGV